MPKGIPDFVFKVTKFYESEKRAASQSCPHDRRELRRRVIRGGGEQLTYQCLKCGDASNPVARSSVPNVNALPAFDRDLQSKYFDECDARIEAIRQKHIAIQQRDHVAWWTWYNQYLQTPEWQDRRQRVLTRAKGVCEGCGQARAEHVHHLTYRNAGAEFLWQLVAVCNPCHDRAHGRKIGGDDDEYGEIDNELEIEDEGEFEAESMIS